MKKNMMYSNVCDFVNYRHDMGLKCCEESSLKLFAKFADRNYPGQPLTIRMAIEWAMLPYPKKKGPQSRIDRLRPFARYMKIRDSRTELIPTRLLDTSLHRFEPYILTSQEIRMFLAADFYVLPQNISERSIRTVVGLLVCTGMRINEVLALKKTDIDWKNGIIFVRNSKRKAIRSLPVDVSTLEALRSYEQFRDSYYPKVKTDLFFFLDDGKPILYKVFWKHWRAAWRRMKDKQGKFAEKCPRVHDLRHTFACNHLLEAYQNKKNVDHELHLLSVYLGHVRVISTYWYLSATPELLEYVGNSFERYVKQTRKEHYR